MLRRLIERIRFGADHRWSPPHMSEYLDGELTEGARVRLERHVHDCDRCREILRSLRTTIASLRGLGRRPAAAPDTTVAPEVLTGFRDRRNEDDERLD